MKITKEKLCDLTNKIEHLILEELPQLENMKFDCIGLQDKNGCSGTQRIFMCLQIELIKAGVIIE